MLKLDDQNKPADFPSDEALELFKKASRASSSDRIHLINFLIAFELAKPRPIQPPPFDQLVPLLHWMQSLDLQNTTEASDGSEDTRMALALLKKDSLSGPERALVVMVKLFNDGKTRVSARQITQTNAHHGGKEFSNISTAVASNVKSGLLQELKSNGQADFRVTDKGFAYYDFLQTRETLEVDGNIPSKVSP